MTARGPGRRLAPAERDALREALRRGEQTQAQIAATFGVAACTVSWHARWIRDRGRAGDVGAPPDALPPPPRPAVSDPAWRDRAACLGVNPALFDDHGTDDAGRDADATAIQVCRPCPVAGDCLTDALTTRSSGIRGGTTWAQRRVMRKPRAAAS